TTTVTFTSGVATSTAKLYKVETAILSVSDGTINSSGHTLSVVVSVAAKSKLLFATQPASSVTAGATWTTFTIEITDPYGNRTSDTDNVTVAASSGSLGGTTTKAAVNGLASFTDITYNTAGSITVNGTATGLTSTGASNTVTVNHATSGVATWTGAVSTDWNDPLNWDIGSVPSATDTVLIPDTATKPVLSSNVSVSSLTVNSGQTLSIGGKTFTVESSAQLLGTINAADSVIIIKGNLTTNSPGTIQGTNATLTVNGYVGTIAHPINIDITGTLTISAGGMNDMVSISMTGITGAINFQGSIPGFVMTNGHVMGQIGQENFRTLLEQVESSLFGGGDMRFTPSMSIVTTDAGVRPMFILELVGELVRKVRGLNPFLLR
ncbi:MAG: hypothetical protein HY209_06655, partial [Candidatus Omnitrophica bacterium]|nr:hypothetical protein [Candidatus Omnitrophota bacterium]